MNNLKEIEAIAKKLQSDYHKKWREKNKKKVSEINKKYWINKAKKELEKNKKED